MSTLTKVFVFLTSIFGIVLSCLFVAAAAQWDNWKQLAQTYQQQAQGELPLLAQMKYETSAASKGLISLPAFRNALLLEAAEGFAKYLKESIGEAEQRVRDNAKR